MALDLQNSAGRQPVMAARIPFTYEDFESGVAQAAIRMSMGSRILGGEIVIEEAFDSATSDTLTVGDENDDDRYAAGVDGQALGRTALTPTGLRHDVLTDVVIKWTGAGAAPTAGAGYVLVEYTIDDRATEVQPA